MAMRFSCWLRRKVERVGASLLAGTGIGVWESVEAACAATVRVAETTAPKNAAVMDEAYKQYRRIYPALREIARVRNGC
jgi:xylulokinase